MLAAFLHGGVATGNCIGAVYNWRRGNLLWFGIHVAGFIAHTYAALDHARDARRAA